MKFHKRSVVIAWLTAFLFTATSGHATNVSFGDQNRYWGDKTNWAAAAKWNTDIANGVWNGNKIDVIGDPNITGGTAAFTSAGRLQRISFDFTSPFKDWRMLAPGNLFINVLSGQSDSTWNYVVNTMGDATLNRNDRSGAIQTLASGNYSIYDISAKAIDAKRGGNDSDYTLSGKDNTSAWAGYYLRNDHPIGVAPTVINELSPVGSVYYSGFPGTVTNGNTWTGSSHYDFTSLSNGGLNLQGKNIIIAWEMTCANDVVYEQVNNPIPEPATMLLFGTGLACLAGIARRRKK